MRKRLTLTVGLIVGLIAAIAASAAIAGPTVVGKDGNTQSLGRRGPEKPLENQTDAGHAESDDQNDLDDGRQRRSLAGDPGGGRLRQKRLALHQRRADLRPGETPGHLDRKGSGGLRQRENRQRQRCCAAPGRRQSLPRPVVITAFNGVPQAGQPVILLHAYGSSAGPDHAGPHRRKSATTTKKASGRGSTSKSRNSPAASARSPTSR